MHEAQMLKGIFKILKGLLNTVSKIDVNNVEHNEELIDYIYNNFEEDEIDKKTIAKVLKYNSWYMQLTMEEISKKLGG